MIAGLRQAVGATATVVIIVLLVAAGLGGVGVGIAWLDGAFSGPIGAAQQKAQTNSAENRTEAQYQFGLDYQAVQTDVADIQQNAENYYQQGDSNLEWSYVAAAQSTCREDVGTYNALAAGTTTSPWRPATDPASINATTECAVPSQASLSSK